MLTAPLSTQVLPIANATEGQTLSSQANIFSGLAAGTTPGAIHLNESAPEQAGSLIVPAKEPMDAERGESPEENIGGTITSVAGEAETTAASKKSASSGEIERASPDTAGEPLVAERGELPEENIGATNASVALETEPFAASESAAPSGRIEKTSPTPAKERPVTERSGAQDTHSGAMKTSATGETETFAAVEGVAPSGRIQPQVENTLQTLPESLVQMQGKPGGQKEEAVAAPLGSGGLKPESTTGIAVSPSVPAPVMPTVAGKTGLENNTRTLGQAATRLTHADAHGDRPLEGQSGQVIQDAANNGSSAALARDPAVVRGTVNLGGESTTNASSHAGPAVRETFAALDAESATGTPTWVHAGAQRAEAGFQDPALGWIGVRADASGGGVHASLVPGSAEAAQALDSHLAGLNAYLAEQHTPVDSLTLAAPEGRWVESGMDQGASQNMHQGAGQDTGQGASSGQQSNPQTGAPVLTPAEVSLEMPAQPGRADIAAYSATREGMHISVMA